MSPPSTPFSYYPHRLLPSLQEPWQAPGRDAGFDAYFAAKRQTQPPTLGRTEIFSPGSRFSICTCSLTIKRPFARARHAALQRGIFFDRLVVEGAENRWEIYRRRPTCFRSLSENPSSSTSRLPSRRCARQCTELLLSSGWPAPSPWQSEIIASRPKKCKRFFSRR